MNEVIRFIEIIISIFIGYYFGKGQKPQIKEGAKIIRHKVREIIHPVKAGAIVRPSVVELNKRSNPDLYGGIEETKKAFDELKIKPL